MGFTSYFQRFITAKKSPFLTRGVPFLLLLIIGSFGLKEFASLRYEFRRNETLKPENLEKLGIKKRKVTLEEEYEKVMASIDLNAWENKRAPRPYEEPQIAQK